MSVDLRDTKRRPGRPANPVLREDLLKNARRAFAANGYAGTSMRELAETCGLTKASLFHHFPSKEALYMEALENLLSELKNVVDSAARVKGGFDERLDTLGSLVLDYLGHHTDAARLLTRELLGGGPYMAQGGAQMVQITLTVIEAFLTRGMNEGAIPRQDSRQLALSIAGLHVYLFAAPEVASAFLGVDVFSKEHIDGRKEAVLTQLRMLCGVNTET